MAIPARAESGMVWRYHVRLDAKRMGIPGAAGGPLHATHHGLVGERALRHGARAVCPFRCRGKASTIGWARAPYGPRLDVHGW